MKREDFSFIQISSLEKVFLDERPTAREQTSISILKDERFSYQIAYAYTGEENKDSHKFEFKISINSPLARFVRIRSVTNVPVELSHYPNVCDDGYLRKRPGLYPDALREMKKDSIEAIPNLWHSIWITVDPRAEIDAGEYELAISFEYEDVKIVKTMSVKIINACLSNDKPLLANFFHSDCLASVYNVKMYSERHWEIIDRFMKCAVDNGVNSIYTPLFSIPLDTNPGCARPACQLVDITVTDGEYSFDFSKLKRWISLFKKNGGDYLEISHIFSQWGAKFAPRIIAKVNGRKKEIFGWHTANTSPEYSRFLHLCIPALINVLREEGVEDRAVFHISDEPHMHTLDSYMAAKGVVDDLLKDYKIIEACSVPDIHLSGAVKYPIVHIPNVEEYLERNITPFGLYFCCSTSYGDYGNRFIDMPSYRNRIIGTQMFKFNINCLLHFGFNYYFERATTGGTDKVINPFLATDAGNAIPGGNGYVVYPGEGGYPIDSMRLDVTFNALQDVRAMKVLEEYIGHEKIVEIIDRHAGAEIKMNKYPKNSSYILELRELINSEIERSIQK